MMKSQSSRSAFFLNQRAKLLGLSEWDYVFLGYGLFLMYHLLLPWGLELLSFVILFLVFLLLLTIRLTKRRKTIRDFFMELPKRIKI